MRHVYLIGFMGAGKSTVGVILADLLGMRFVDLDAHLERARGMSVADMFEADGEESFRRTETEALREIAASSPAVIACGGGVVIDHENRALIRQTGVAVHLKVGADEAIARIGTGSSRPLLARGDAARIVRELLPARNALYAAIADVEVDTAGVPPADVAGKAAELVAALFDARAFPATLLIDVPSAPYEVVVGRGLLPRAGALISEVTRGGAIGIVSDRTVHALYGQALERSLAAHGFRVSTVLVEPGEASKAWSVAGDVVEQLASAGLERTDAVVALGGGVVGDLAGFAAAVYLRGVGHIQVPTTLLAQVDSSVGGKTGVDLVAGKNLAGAFAQPLLVIADTATLDSLPRSEWVNGLAEVAKAAMLEGAMRVDWLTSHVDALTSRDSAAIKEALTTAIRLKASVVAADAREDGVRECLNYGHTLGHAIERVAGYGAIPHGVAVAEGMRFAAALAERAIGAPRATGRAQAALLDALDIPRPEYPADPKRLLDAMRADKKVRDGAVRFVFVPEPGSHVVAPVDDALIVDVLADFVARS